MDHSIPCSQGVFLICVDSWDSSSCSGRFTSAAIGESGSFRDLTRLLMQIESCLNLQPLPQSFCTLRQFDRGTDLWPALEMSDRIKPGALATFHVRIRFRRNASWQGTVTWLEHQETMHFRSALELLGLIDSALSAGALEEATPLRMEG